MTGTALERELVPAVEAQRQLVDDGSIAAARNCAIRCAAFPLAAIATARVGNGKHCNSPAHFGPARVAAADDNRAPVLNVVALLWPPGCVPIVPDLECC